MDRDRSCHQVALLIGGIGGIEAGEAGGGRSEGRGGRARVAKEYAKHPNKYIAKNTEAYRSTVLIGRLRQNFPGS